MSINLISAKLKLQPIQVSSFKEIISPFGIVFFEFELLGSLPRFRDGATKLKLGGELRIKFRDIRGPTMVTRKKFLILPLEI